MLKRIGEIEIGENTSFDVAKNGVYQLVQCIGEDAYGTPMYATYDMVEAEKNGSLYHLCNGLVQVIGKLLSEKQAVTDSRKAALQGAKVEE